MNKKEIIISLEVCYPDKKVRSISTEHRKLYESIIAIARKQGLSVGALLKSWGFQYDFGGIEFDPAMAIQLHDQFHVPYKRFSEWTGYTKQMISYLVTGYLNDTQSKSAKMTSWSGAFLSEDEIAIAAEMIAKKLFLYSKAGITCVFGNNRAGKVYLTVIGIDSIKVYFQDTIPASLLREIRQNRMDILSKKEMDFVQRGTFSDVLLTPHFTPDPSMESAFYAAAFNKSMSIDDFSIYLTGYPCTIALDKTPDRKIIKFLKANQVGDQVYISNHPSNQWIRSIASRRNVSLNQLASLYGFKLADKGFSRSNLAFSR